MEIAVIASSRDSAGINIRKNLIKLFNFKDIEKFGNSQIFQYNNIKLYLIDDDLIFAERIDKKINADVFIFASKHRSKENTPSFTAHPIGNWEKADFGGKEKTLCFSSAFLLKNLYLSLVQNSHLQKNANFEVTLEATHHGPYVEKPAVFVEIGSTEKEWNDVLNGEIIAKTIINGLMKQESDFISTILLGGGHYNQAGNKIMLKTDYAIGHVCPKHVLEHLDEEILMQAINKTIPKPNIVLLDWKGLSIHKQKIVGLLEKLNIRYERIQNMLH